MTEHVDFELQETLRTEDGRLRPDARFLLPEGRSFVADSKVPLDAFLDAQEAEVESERRVHLERHARQAREHVRALSSKDYQGQFKAGEMPDLVICFIPNEPALHAAFAADPDALRLRARAQRAAGQPDLADRPAADDGAGLAPGADGRRGGRDRRRRQHPARPLRASSSATSTRSAGGLDSATNAYNSAVGSMEGRLLPQLRKVEEPRRRPRQGDRAAGAGRDHGPRDHRAGAARGAPSCRRSRRGLPRRCSELGFAARHRTTRGGPSWPLTRSAVAKLGRRARHAAGDDGRLGDPPGARGRAQRRLPARADRGARARRLRGDRPGDGGRRQLQQRLGGAGQAGLGLRLRRPPRVRPPHRRLRRLRDRLEGRRGRHPLEARRRGRRSTATRPPTRTSRSTGSTRWPRRASGSGATRRPGAPSPSSPRCRRSSCCRRPQNLSWADSSSYGLTYFTAYRMLIDQCKLQAGHNVLIWGAAGGLGVFAVQLCKAAGANAVGVVSSDEKGELVKQLGAVDYINRNEFGEMMRTDGEPRRPGRRQGALQGLARLRQAGQGDPRRRPRHRLRARRPGDLPDLGLRRQAVRQSRHLRRHLGLPARLRRALPVDAPEADHRLPLRQRLRVHEGQPADGRGQGPAGALADDGLRRRPRAPTS